MKAKKLIIPEENVGAVLTALRIRAATLQVFANDYRNTTEVRKGCQEDLAVITMTADNLEENPIESI